MRRVMVTYGSQGGLCHYTYSLADALQASGDDISVLMYDYTPYELAGIPHRHSAKTSLHVGKGALSRLIKPLESVQTLLRESRGSDIVHYQSAVGVRNDLLQWKTLKRAGKKIVFTAHDVVPHDPNRRHQEHDAWLYRTADALIVHGQRLKDLLLDVSGVPAEKVHVIPHGNYNFVADRFDRWDRGSARASLGLSEDEQVVLFFGYVREYKGLDTLIAACDLVSKERRDIGRRLRLLLAGGPLGNDDHWREGGYAQMIEQHGLGEKTKCAIEFVPLEDVARYFLAADVVALPYKRGSQSGVLQLAYAFSRPVIVTNVGSIPEVVQDGVTGLIVPPNDPAAFAQAIIEALCDPDTAARIGRQGRAYADTVLSWEPIAARTQQVYRRVGRPA